MYNGLHYQAVFSQTESWCNSRISLLEFILKEEFMFYAYF